MEVTRKTIDDLIQDIHYLQDELEALKYVISEVPVMEKPPGQPSILEMLALIKHAQAAFYRPLVEKISDTRSRNNVIDYDYKNTLDAAEYEEQGVEYLINKTIKHRVSFVTLLQQKPAQFWEYAISIKGQEKTIFKLLHEMVTFERGQLKSVAERVLTLEDKKNR